MKLKDAKAALEIEEQLRQWKSYRRVIGNYRDWNSDEPPAELPMKVIHYDSMAIMIPYKQVLDYAEKRIKELELELKSLGFELPS